MHAILAKPLDWCVMKFARPCAPAQSNPRGARTVAVPRLGAADVLLKSPVALPADWSIGDHGEFSYASPVRTAAEVNNRVYGRFFPVGKKWAENPTVLLLHGWNADVCYRHLFPWLANRLKRAGCNTAMIELPYHMRRRPRNGPVRDFISSDLESMVEATHQGIADIRALGRWLENQGARSFGLWGFSLGAWLAGLTACVESSLGFAVLTTPIVRIDRGIAELPFCEPVRRGLRGHQFDLSGLNLTSHRPRIERKRLLLMQSRHDLFAPAETVEELWRAWDRPELWRLEHGHISVLMSFSALERTIHWIAGHPLRPRG